MQGQTFSEDDRSYINQNFEVMIAGYIDSFQSGRISADDFDRSLWKTPRTLLEYYFKLPPKSALQPYYDLVKPLNRRCMDIIEKYCCNDPECRDSVAARIKKIANYSTEFSFRPWEMDDLPVYQAFLNNPKLWEMLIDDYDGPIDTEKATLLLNNSNSMPFRHDVSAVVWNENIVGQVRLEFSEENSKEKEAAEISYWLGEEYWGKGLMSKIIPVHTQNSFKKYPLESIYAMVLDNHSSSKKILEKAGYRLDTSNFRSVKKNDSELPYVMYRAFRSDFLPNSL